MNTNEPNSENSPWNEDQGRPTEAENAADAEAPAKVFISYSHDTKEHAKTVLGLFTELKDAGFDVYLDQDRQAPDNKTNSDPQPENWADELAKKLPTYDYILLVCSPRYKRLFEGDIDADGRGRGVRYEGQIVRRLIYDKDGSEKNRKEHGKTPHPVVILDVDGKSDFVPTLLQGSTEFHPFGVGGAKELIRFLTRESLPLEKRSLIDRFHRRFIRPAWGRLRREWRLRLGLYVAVGLLIALVCSVSWIYHEEKKLNDAARKAVIRKVRAVIRDVDKKHELLIQKIDSTHSQLLGEVETKHNTLVVAVDAKIKQTVEKSVTDSVKKEMDGLQGDLLKAFRDDFYTPLDKSISDNHRKTTDDVYANAGLLSTLQTTTNGIPKSVDDLIRKTPVAATNSDFNTFHTKWGESETVKTNDRSSTKATLVAVTTKLDNLLKRQPTSGGTGPSPPATTPPESVDLTSIVAELKRLTASIDELMKKPAPKPNNEQFQKISIELAAIKKAVDAFECKPTELPDNFVTLQTTINNFIDQVNSPAAVAACVKGDCPDRVAANWYVALARLALSDGDTQHADEMLDCGLQFAIEDARYTYLRAIIALEEGKKEKAEMFARRAAKLEREGKPSSSAVSNFLEPFQGGHRQWIECIRREKADCPPPAIGTPEKPATEPALKTAERTAQTTTTASRRLNQSSDAQSPDGGSPKTAASKIASRKRAELFRQLLRQIHSDG